MAAILVVVKINVCDWSILQIVGYDPNTLQNAVFETKAHSRSTFCMEY
jgi:hypothetical protein